MLIIELAQCQSRRKMQNFVCVEWWVIDGNEPKTGFRCSFNNNQISEFEGRSKSRSRSHQDLRCIKRSCLDQILPTEWSLSFLGVLWHLQQVRLFSHWSIWYQKETRSSPFSCPHSGSHGTEIGYFSTVHSRPGGSKSKKNQLFINKVLWV